MTTISEQKILKFVHKQSFSHSSLNENQEYTKLTIKQQQTFDLQFNLLEDDQKQAWIQYSINEISSIIVDGHLHKAQTFFVFLIQTIDEHSLNMTPFHEQIEDLLQRCFMNQKKLRRKQIEDFSSIFKQIGVQSTITDKKKSSHKQSFFAKLCACFSWK